MKNKATCYHAVEILGNMVNDEIKAISSSRAGLVYQSKESMKGFKWSELLTIVSKSAPNLFTLLSFATKTHGARTNRSAVIGMCFALLLKHRNPQLNLIQKIVSLILYAGHCSKQVRLHVNRKITTACTIIRKVIIVCTLIPGTYISTRERVCK